MSKTLKLTGCALILLIIAGFIWFNYLHRENAAPVIEPKVLLRLNAARKACASANIVICCLDAARRDHLSCYGYERPTTPALDQLAGEGVCFENAVSDAAYTLGAIASLWTSQSVDSHGLSAVDMRLSLDTVTLPKICKKAGLRTAVFSTSANVIKAHGFGDGVDKYLTVPFDETQQAVFDKIQLNYRQWLDETGKDRFFMYLHVMPPHHPYEYAGPFKGKFSKNYQSSLEPTLTSLAKLDKKTLQASEQDRRHIIALYDEALRYADSIVGTLVSDLQQRGLLDNTILVVMADHGEAFAEHGRWLHSSTVFNELTHIPLIVRFPKSVKLPAKTVPDLVQLSDLAPTLASLAGLTVPPDSFKGKDLSPALFGGAGFRHAAFSRCLAEPNLLWSVEIPGAKGIFNQRGNLTGLYDLTTDPGEKQDIKGTDVMLAQQLTAIWQKWAPQQPLIGAAIKVPPQKLEMDEEIKKSLRSLGYL
jgi:arylsulfatase